MNIVCLLFDDLTVLDAIGPYQVLTNLPSAKVTFVAERAGSVRSDDRALSLTAAASIDDVRSCDLLLVPGGFGARRLQKSERVLGWLRDMDRTSTLTASVCTGALALGAAGLLAGRRATTHWAFAPRALGVTARGATSPPVRTQHGRGSFVAASSLATGSGPHASAPGIRRGAEPRRRPNRTGSALLFA